MARKPRVHPSITLERVMEAAQRHSTSLDDPGFCLACGIEVDGVEQDARRYACEACGEEEVYGAEELLLRMAT